MPNTLPTSSIRTSSRPTSRNSYASQAPRADSPNGGAGMRAISICHWTSCGSCVRNQLNADRTSGDAASRATSCCIAGATSGISARGGVGLMGSYGSYYNAWGGKGDWLWREPLRLFRYCHSERSQCFADPKHWRSRKPALSEAEGDPLQDGGLGEEFSSPPPNRTGPNS